MLQQLDSLDAVLLLKVDPGQREAHTEPHSHSKGPLQDSSGT